MARRFLHDQLARQEQMLFPIASSRVRPQVDRLSNDLYPQRTLSTLGAPVSGRLALPLHLALLHYGGDHLA
jgi:hypothetical protein